MAADRLSGKYVKLPIPVQCEQWFKNGDHPDDNTRMISTNPHEAFESEGQVVRYYRHPSMNGDDVHKDCGRTYHEHGFIDTLEGGHRVCPGDIIITGVQGERYPCKPGIFAESYIRA